MLSKTQASILASHSAVLQVIAAAGSGKTRTIVELVEDRLRRGRAAAGRVLMLSFSRKACAEIRARLSPEARSAVLVSTFHALAYSWMRRRHNGLSIITDVERERFMSQYLSDRDTGGVPVSVLLRNKREFFAHMPRLCFDVHRAFALHKRGRGALEFDDLVRGMLRGLANGEFEEERRSFDLVVVDEFQDTDAEQLCFLRALHTKQLVVVGDDYQSIYSFRGSNPQIFLKFARHFPGVERFFLTENYRSYRQITDCGNRIIKHAHDRLKKRVVSMRGSRPALPASAAAVFEGSEEMILPALKAGAVILCRSNHRRFSWLRAGALPEQVMTIHASKGLEFSSVLLDLTGGYSSLRGIERVPDEEVRIAYVGLTRAMNFLSVLFDPAHSDREPERLVFEMFRPYVRRTALDELPDLCREGGRVSGFTEKDLRPPSRS